MKEKCVGVKYVERTTKGGQKRTSDLSTVRLSVNEILAYLGSQTVSPALLNRSFEPRTRSFERRLRSQALIEISRV